MHIENWSFNLATFSGIGHSFSSITDDLDQFCCWGESMSGECSRETWVTVRIGNSKNFVAREQTKGTRWET